MAEQLVSERLCPCCGRQITYAEGDYRGILAVMHFSPLEQRVVDFMASRFGAIVRTPELVAYAYQGRGDGGPIQAEFCVARAVHDVKQKLGSTKLLIQTVRAGKKSGRCLRWA